MKWYGSKPCYIGYVNEKGETIKYEVKPGEEIPKEALELLKNADDITGLPYGKNSPIKELRDGYDDETVNEIMRRK
jgi:hypothetical protein